MKASSSPLFPLPSSSALLCNSSALLCNSSPLLKKNLLLPPTSSSCSVGLKVENVSLKFCSRSSSSRKTHLTCLRSAAQRASTRFSEAVISMEQQAGDVSFPGLRQSNLKKSFKLAIRSLLTTCSKEDFMNVFPTLGKAKQETLYLMFIQVISSVHHNIEEEFASICDETRLGTTLDTVEQLVEEQTLDILSNDNRDMTSLAEVKQELSKAKKDRIRYLTDMLEKVVDQNHSLKAQINALTRKTLDGSLDTTDAVGRLRSWNSYLL